ncbi:hypothetical protein JIQ42_06440 [Leishmania sp. Namibia]|uniref:hypothetical protein n=1 Tax=Leishmania sp. Namibia TaxID=2802991 RepID=UPI001B5869E8|nr:hypothetical protein JIQ42_06440 [Leishmania sp. Namibia]
MSGGHNSSPETRSNDSGAQASASLSLPATPLASPPSHLTPSPASSARDSQCESVGCDRADNQERPHSGSSSPCWEGAEEELDADVEYLSGNYTGGADECGSGSESSPGSGRGAPSEPLDAPLTVPDWLPTPPPSSSPSQRTDEEESDQRGPSLVPDAEHSNFQDESVAADTALLHGYADGADSRAAAARDAEDGTQAKPGVSPNAPAAVHSQHESLRSGEDVPSVAAASEDSDGVAACGTPGEVSHEPESMHAYRESVDSDAATSETDSGEQQWQGARGEADDLSDAAEAALAASITSEVVAESVWASEERASAALQQFSTSLHSKLVEELIDDAAAAVERTLQDTVRQHESRVRALMAQNRLLDRQLADQAEQMQSIRKDLEDSVLRDLQRVLRVDLRQAFRSAAADSLDCKEASAEATTPLSSFSSRGSSSVDEHRFSAEEDTGDSIGTRQRSSAAPASLTDTGGGAAASSVEELVAAYLNQRGTLELLHKERAQWQKSMAVLRDKLLGATREVVQLRQEVERLQTTTVDVTEHRTVVQAKEEAEHQCALMRLQLAKYVEEAEMLEALVERRELTQSQPHVAAEGNAEQEPSTRNNAAVAAAAAALDEERLRKGPQWDIAFRELEEQATVAANSRQLREQLANVEARLHSLQRDRDASVTYAAELKKEGDVLRADLQSMVYRNSVLSQQVASLLVKVEHTCRANRQLQARQTVSPSLQRKSRLSPPGAEKAKGSSGASTASRSSSSTFPGPSNALMSALPSQAARRSAWLSAMWPSPPSGGANMAAQNRLDTAILYGPQKHLRRPPSPLASVGTSQVSSPMEVEEGVQQRLSTYVASHVAAPQLSSDISLQPTRRQRHVSLRQLGSATLKVERVCSPHLPASHHLSGYALGHPSAFSTVDVARGTVTRQVGAEEVTVLLAGEAGSPAHGSPSPAAPEDSRGGDGDVWTSAAAATPSTRRVHSTDDVSRDPNLLRLLDTLNQDENLDRFSINSVSELLLRNQELVTQLYETTQRAEAAERQQQRRGAPSAARWDEKGPLSGAKADSAGDPIAQSSNGAGAHLDAVPATLTSTTAALLLQEDELRSRKRTRESDEDDGNRGKGDVAGARHVSGGQSKNQAQQLQAADGARAASAAPSVTESWLTKDASDTVASMIDAMVRRRDVRLTSADTEVSRALLKALAAQRATENAVQQARADGGGIGSIDPVSDAASEVCSSSASTTSRAVFACLSSLLQLCVRQSAALAQVALTAADQHRDMQATVKSTWTEVQQTLLAALQTSSAALTSSASSSHNDPTTGAPWPPCQRVRQEGDAMNNSDGSVGSVVVADEGHLRRDGLHELRPEEQVALLQQLRALLHTAARKDETLLHVYQAAQARKELRQHQEKERLTRLLLKLERKRRLIKALQMRHANMSLVTAVGAEPNTCGLSHPSPMDYESSQGNVAVGFRPSPKSGSPVRRTPPMPPMVLPAASTANADDEHRGDDDCDRASSADSGSNRPQRSHHHRHCQDDDGDSDDELDDEVLTLDIFRELQQHLALSQASHQAAQEELDAEKAKHAALLERMWVLETACDDATAEAARLEKRVGEMRTREEYEAAVAELEVATTALAERETELRDAKATHRELQEQVDDLKRQLETQRQEAKLHHGQLEDAMRKREQRLLREEGRSRQLQAQLRDVKQYAASLEESISLAQREVHDQRELVCHKDSMIEELKAQMLMRDDVQELLCRLYPDHSVLHANTQLVHRLSEMTARLQLELAETRQDLAHIREELQQRELSVREAVQDRQAAEVRLQDALTRLAALQEADGGADSEPRSAEEEASTCGTTRPQTADAASRMAALFNVDEAPLAALRQRVRYLNTCVEAQAKDIAVLRAAESSWKRREADLRKQLEIMSTDPVSLTARRYGLAACLSFEEQLAEMQARQNALKDSVAQLEAEKNAIAVTVQEHVKAADAAQAVVERTTAQLASTTEKCATQSSTIARLEREHDEELSKRLDLERQYEQVVSELTDTKHDLSAVQESLKTSVTQRDRFWEDNNLLISKVEELEKALLQSDAEKLAAREALAQGLSASAARRRRGGGGDSSAADRYRGQASLTQDLSLSSLSARPS